MSDIKTCKICLTQNSKESFKFCYCLACWKIKEKTRKKKYRQEHLDKCRELGRKYKKKYYSDNVEKCREKSKEIYHRDLSLSRAKSRQRDRKRISKIIDYRKSASEKIKEYHINYRLLNKEKLKINKRKYDKNAYYQNPKFKIRILISNSIFSFLKKKKRVKQQSCWKFLPFSKEQLKQHLESLFEPWMNWNNHGQYKLKVWDDQDQSTWTWQIDHIIPHSSFHYSSMEDEDFKICWSLNNLRPLNSKQNLLESNRKIIEFPNARLE